MALSDKASLDNALYMQRANSEIYFTGKDHSNHHLTDLKHNKYSNQVKVPNIFGNDFYSSNNSSLKNTNLINYMSFNNTNVSNNIAAEHLKDRSAFKRIINRGEHPFRMIKSPKSEYNIYSNHRHHHNNNNKNTSNVTAPKELPSPMISVNNDFKDDQSNVYNILDKNREDVYKNNVFYQGNSSNNAQSINEKSSILSFKDNQDQSDYQYHLKAALKDPFINYTNLKRNQPNNTKDMNNLPKSIYEPGYMFSKNGSELPNQKISYNMNDIGNLQSNMKLDTFKNDIRNKSSQRKQVISNFHQIIPNQNITLNHKNNLDDFFIQIPNEKNQIEENNQEKKNDTENIPNYNYTKKSLNFQSQFKNTQTMNKIQNVSSLLQIQDVKIFKLIAQYGIPCPSSKINFKDSKNLLTRIFLFSA